MWKKIYGLTVKQLLEIFFEKNGDIKKCCSDENVPWVPTLVIPCKCTGCIATTAGQKS